jgi:hypothetical protein
MQTLVLACACSAVALTAVWSGFPLWAVIGMSCLPLTPALYTYSVQLRPYPQFLRLHPHHAWQIVAHDEKNTRSVALLQSWRHFFGVTLSLKILNCPHNEQETVRMTVWQCNITPDVYRQLCVMVAWRLDQPQAVRKLETV